ncbi:MAG: hypothetical protein ACYDGY_08945, partial [Acidimicrobiales bacterium]
EVVRIDPLAAQSGVKNLAVAEWAAQTFGPGNSGAVRIGLLMAQTGLKNLAAVEWVARADPEVVRIDPLAAQSGVKNLAAVEWAASLLEGTLVQD